MKANFIATDGLLEFLLLDEQWSISFQSVHEKKKEIKGQQM